MGVNLFNFNLNIMSKSKNWTTVVADTLISSDLT